MLVWDYVEVYVRITVAIEVYWYITKDSNENVRITVLIAFLVMLAPLAPRKRENYKKT